jgi:hypothetical protein
VSAFALTFFRFWEWLALSPPALSTPSLFGTKRERKPIKGTGKLYVMKVDFPVNEATRDAIEKSLDPVREKYGIDFILLEPGIHLSRFDDV